MSASLPRLIVFNILMSRIKGNEMKKVCKLTSVWEEKTVHP